MPARSRSRRVSSATAPRSPVASSGFNDDARAIRNTVTPSAHESVATRLGLRCAEGGRTTAMSDAPMPAIYLGHGAPPLLEDPVWMGELGGWAAGIPKPSSILIVSAHWQTAPMAISATETVPLVYDFYGFPEHYYRLQYAAPGAPELAAKVRGLMP